MSIPDRLWRVVRGYWDLAEDRIEEAEAQAQAYHELAEALRRSKVPPGEASPEAVPEVLPYDTEAQTQAASRKGGLGHDPLAASYEILGVQPGCPLEEVDSAYQKRLEAADPERYPSGSPERGAMEARREAIAAAYEKLRDALDLTETRFERLEF